MPPDAKLPSSHKLPITRHYCHHWVVSYWANAWAGGKHESPRIVKILPGIALRDQWRCTVLISPSIVCGRAYFDVERLWMEVNFMAISCQFISISCQCWRYKALRSASFKSPGQRPAATKSKAKLQSCKQGQSFAAQSCQPQGQSFATQSCKPQGQSFAAQSCKPQGQNFAAQSCKPQGQSFAAKRCMPYMGKDKALLHHIHRSKVLNMYV